MSFFDIRHLKSSDAAFVSRPKKYRNEIVASFTPVKLKNVTAQMALKVFDQKINSNWGRIYYLKA
jgi:hypothetical protein